MLSVSMSHVNHKTFPGDPLRPSPKGWVRLLSVCEPVEYSKDVALTVQIPPTRLGDPPAALLLILFQHPNLLESLHYFPVHRPTCVDMVARSGAAVFGRAMDFSQAPHADGFSQVYVACHGGCASVEPG
jgi:hypothetical protein